MDRRSLRSGRDDKGEGNGSIGSGCRTDGCCVMPENRRSGKRQAIPVLGLPLPTPRPAGAEWIEAYRYWARGG